MKRNRRPPLELAATDIEPQTDALSRDAHATAGATVSSSDPHDRQTPLLLATGRHRADPRRSSRAARHRRPGRSRWERVRCLLCGLGLGLLSVFLLGLLSGPAAASPRHGASLVTTTATNDLKDVVGRATDWLIGILATIATFFLTWGGAKYLAAGGDPAEVERAKGSLKNAGIGYALAVLAPVFLKILQSILGVPQ